MLDRTSASPRIMRSTSRPSSTGCCRATACPSTRCRRRNTPPTTRRSPWATTPKRRWNCWPPPASAPTTRCSFKIQTTRGFKPKDYEIIQAIVGLWRRVGIEAEIEVYEIAKHFELRAADQLAPAAFYNWGNSVGDPATSTGFAMFGPSPHSVWDGEDMIEMIGRSGASRTRPSASPGFKEVDRKIAEDGLVIPLFQYVQPIVHADGVTSRRMPRARCTRTA
jgi:hypothetical protein